jgi:glycosyltransferase involved in cell wall biosynthesis
MRFHVISLPHTQTTKDYVNCAYTEKVRRFCMMMKGLGHTVYLYASEDNEAPVDELITCITKEQQQEALDGKHFTEAEFNNELPHWQIFNGKAIKELGKRLEKKDFICLIGGASQEPIAKAYPSHISVEFGVGYGGVFSQYKVFESYAWMHSIYAMFKNPTTVDGNFYDAVIPGYLEPEMFPLQEKKEDYYLYVGRMVDRKGIGIAQHVCKEMGLKLILAGPGKDPKVEYGEWVGPVGPDERAKLMGGAIALFAPTLYIEPFGNVVIEAQACGTPTITTDWGAFTETNPTRCYWIPLQKCNGVCSSYRVG